MTEASQVLLASGTGPVGTGRFLFGSKKDSSGRLTAEEWLAVLFLPIVPRRSVSLQADVPVEDGLLAIIEASAPLSGREAANRYLLSLGGLAVVVLTLALIYLSSSNTGLFGGLLVVSGGGLLVAFAGYLDWLRPRISEHSGVEG